MSVWLSSAAGAGAVAVVELDAAAIGPFLLSRPFVAGPLVGWLRGDAWSGALMGAAFEAVTLEDLPLGGSLSLSAAVAAGAAAWLASGPSALPREAAFAAGLAAGWAHAAVERALRRGRGFHARRAESALAEGRSPALGREILAAISEQAAATFVVIFAVLAAAGPALSRLWPLLPEFLRAGMRTAFLAAPWLSAGALVSSLLRRAS